MTLMPNMRLLGLPSEQEGRDWDKLSKKIDSRLESDKLDLAEETVFVTFSGSGEARVSRSVIGGKKDYPSPWVLEDWVAAQVESITIQDNDWEGIFEQVDAFREKTQREGKRLEKGFMLKLTRRLATELSLGVEVFFRFF